MNRFRSGLVPLFALLAAVGCNSEPTGDLREGVNLTATPTQLFIEVGETKEVIIGAVDNQGNPLDFNYEITETGSGISVRRDSSYLPIFVDDSTLQAPATGPRFRFIVEGTAYTATEFSVEAGGDTITIPVQVVPQQGLAATFDNPTPALGEVVTLTAPAGITFNEDATLEVGGNPITIVSQDASSIAFIPPPNVNGPITVNGVVSAAAPDVVLNPSTDEALVTPLIDTVAVTYSTTTPALGETVTLSSTDPLIKLAVDSIVFPGQLPGREADPQNIVIAPDSLSLTFDAPPNAEGSGSVVNFLFPGGYLLALPTLPNLTSTNIGLSLPIGISNATPAVSETVTLTAPAGYSFATDSVIVTVGGNRAVVVSQAADGSTVGIVPLPGSAGIPQVDGIVPDAAPLNILTMPAEGDITVPAEVPTLAGTDDPSTAPELDTPALGDASVLFDRPNFETSIFAFYKLVVTQAGGYDITMDWNVGGDLDLFICEEPLAPDFSNCDFTAATGAHPEHAVYNLDPGTYNVVINDFGEDAAGTTLVLTVRHGPTVVEEAFRKAALVDPAKLQRLRLRK